MKTGLLLTSSGRTGSALLNGDPSIIDSRPLAGYLSGALGMAVVIGAPQLQSAVIYWNPADAVATGQSGTGFRFDMVSGAITPAAFAGDRSANGFVVWNYTTADYVQLSRTTSLLDPVVGGDYMSNLAGGDSIGVASPFGGYSFTYFDRSNASGFPWNTNADGTTGYVGLRFSAIGNPASVNYGWARFTYDDATTGNITLHDFAYEDVAGQPILAGAGAAVAVVPEPSRALLALAGLCGVALKRRRK